MSHSSSPNFIADTLYIRILLCHRIFVSAHCRPIEFRTATLTIILVTGWSNKSCSHYSPSPAGHFWPKVLHCKEVSKSVAPLPCLAAHLPHLLDPLIFEHVCRPVPRGMNQTLTHPPGHSIGSSAYCSLWSQYTSLSASLCFIKLGTSPLNVSH